MIGHLLNPRRHRRKKDTNLAIDTTLRSAYAEAFRTLRTNLHFAAVNRPMKSILITSALPSEGKSTTAVNLAMSMAQTGNRVLLVDADLRKPMLTQFFNLKETPGLTHLIMEALDSPLDSGNLADFSPGDLIRMIQCRRLSGTLEIQTAATTMGLVFQEGEPLEIQWPEKKEISHVDQTIQQFSGPCQGRYRFHDGIPSPQHLPASPDTDFSQLFQPLFSTQGDHITRQIHRAIRPTDTPNLHVLGAGTPPPNPSEIIASQRTTEIMAILKQQFDTLIVDMAPSLPASDALLMAPRTDGVLLVVRYGHSARKQVKQAAEQFIQSGLPILGFVLNRVEQRDHSYYYEYYGEG